MKLGSSRPDAGTAEIGDVWPEDVLATVADVAGFRAAAPSAKLWVEIPRPRDADIETAIDLACAAGADGIAALVTETTRDIEQLGCKLAVREARLAMPTGHFRIVAIVGTPSSTIAMRSWSSSGMRLAALMLDEPALASEIGCSPNSAPIMAMRGAVVLAAAAAGIPAWIRPVGGGATAARHARRDGFAGLVLSRTGAISTLRGPSI